MEDSIDCTARKLIVIGASLGGIAALKQILSHLTPDLPAAVAIVLHSGPDSPMVLDSIWEGHTRLPVAYARGAEQLRAGHVYIAPPDQHLSVIEGRRLHLDAGPKLHHSRPAVDRLFESAVAVYGNQVIGVILIGGDGDGSAGMRAIHAAGGIGVVQEPSDSQDPSMPLTALRTDHPRYCLPLRDIGGLLQDLAERP
jgi:two-component system chemotaxis response regulator CheB